MKNLLFVALFTFFSIGLIAQTDILPPELNSPDSAAINQMADVELDWYAVSGVGLVTYTVQIDTNSQFQNPATITIPTSAYITENLNFGEIYFWRVQASDDTGPSDWSDINSFTVMNDIALSSPSNGDTTGVAPDVRLVWSNRQVAKVITGITYYEVQLSSLDTNFTTIDYADSVAYGTFPEDTAFYYTNTKNLLFDTTYYWRVRAKHETDVCDWSEVWSFMTVEGVSLVSPADGATDQHVTTELEWEEISGIESYIYQVCTDPNFTFPCLTSFTSLNSVMLPQFFFGEMFYWRVKAAHLLDTTYWSDIRSFEIINKVLLTSPAQGDTAGLEPLLKWEYIYGAEQYELHYWAEDNSTMEIEITDTSFFQIYKILDIGMNYNWKVRSFWDSDTTEWSETRTFLSQASQGYGDLFLNKENITIFPNPTNGVITVELTTQGQKTVRISVVDLLGKTVIENTFMFDQGLVKKTINLDHLNNGLYLIRLQSEGKIYTEKLVIDK
ncbi:MAG: T9SS type A sorting domain-containing protein [Bacteroidales bacterium]|nr:T9SS type A sorting domain-containing protein [Bacteroidales bacterium]